MWHFATHAPHQSWRRPYSPVADGKEVELSEGAGGEVHRFLASIHPGGHAYEYEYLVRWRSFGGSDGGAWINARLCVFLMCRIAFQPH